MNIPAFGVRAPVVANLVMIAIIGAGIIFGLTLRREFFPEVDPTRVIVSAPYPGATPDEVEDALATKIEDRLIDLRDVKEVTSVVTEGAASVTIEFEKGIDIDVAVADVKREVDALQDLPDAADRIVVTKLEPNLPAIVLALSGPIDGPEDERNMKNAIRSIRDDLRTLPGMGDITLSGTRTDEITVEVRPGAMLEHGLSMPVIADRIRAAMLEIPGGTVRTATSNIAIRSVGVAEEADTIREIVVKGTPGGGVVRLCDIASVTNGFADVDLFTRLNGTPTVSLTVFQVGDQDIVSISDMVKAYVAGRNGEAFEPRVLERARMLLRRPGDTDPINDRQQAHQLGVIRQATPLPGELSTTTDLARFVVGRLDLLTRNALAGGLLVFGVLVLLLNWRISLWVAAGLAVSLLGTLAVMAWIGVTLNLLTMFGLIIVIGILVDDAIVVAENITRRHELGEPALIAGVRGTNQVAWPVVATVLTTICAFLPLGLIDGEIGDFLRVLPIVVACALLVSLIEGLFILPSHMAHSLSAIDRQRGSIKRGLFARMERGLDNGREWFFGVLLVPRYLKTLRWCLRNRYAAVAASIAILMGSMGMIAGGFLEFIFFETDDAETVNVEVRMPIGTPALETDRVIRKVEAAAILQPEVASAWAQAGAIGDLEGRGGDSSQSHLGQVILELEPVETRDRSSDQVMVSIRQALGELPTARSIRMQGVSGGPGGPAFTLTIAGDDPGSVDAVADEVKHLMATYDGVYDISDDIDRGQREVQFVLRDGASELGFTRATLGSQIQGLAFGLEAFTFAGDREDVDVRVRAPQDVRRSIADVEAQFVFTPDGTAVPLSEVAEFRQAESFATIRRLDRQRAITVNADIDRARANPEEVIADMRPQLAEIESRYPGVRVLERGRQQDTNESLSTLPLGMVVALGLIYVILAWLFSSYTQPLVVMSAIPFAMIGMIWGHIALGYSMTFLSLIGFVALSGVVVNDSLIFMEFFNEQRREGKSIADACVSAGRARLRAILLTTVTTSFGLLPLMLEQSFQARFLIPMAITIACGLISATFVILLVLPCLLMILEDVRRLVVTLWTGRREAERHVVIHEIPEEVGGGSILGGKVPLLEHTDTD
jgi:HAE1 family hydrophobic/amphiphilic exporter-1